MKHSEVDGLVEYHPNNRNGELKIIVTLSKTSLLGDYDREVVIAAMLQDSVESFDQFERNYLTQRTSNGVSFYLWTPERKEITELRDSELAEAAKWDKEQIEEIMSRIS